MSRLESLGVAAGLDVELVIGVGPRAVAAGRVDLAVQVSTRAPDGLHASSLINLDGIAVCSPRLGYGADMPHNLSELCQRPRLAVAEPANLWKRWLARLGCRDDGPGPKSFVTQSLAYEAAASGLGIALEPSLATAI